MKGSKAVLPAAFAVLCVWVFAPQKVFAHCDGLDGPVVKAAQQALEAGDVNRVLIWVQKRDEGEIRSAFQQTLAVRKLSPEAQRLADTWFFETLVRIHRAGEGAPFTGLKPAGRDLGPAIPAADRAIETGAIDGVLKLLPDAAHQGVRDRFAEVMAKKSFKKDDVDGGREYVEAYVAFIHYVEEQYATASTHGHRVEAGEPGMKVQIPEPLKAEHEELHAELIKATQAGGGIGAAATTVARLLHPHFVKEEEYALPPLGLLSAVATGAVTPAMREVLAMSDKLKAELPQMLAEHKAIVGALETLKAEAKTQGNEDVARFAEKLVLHAQTEEQVMYPAAILIGEYLKLKFHQ